jgi:FkbM family methyltransferase
MRKIFIDCGSHDGCSVRKFDDLYDVDNEYEFHCFEGNPNLFKWHPVNKRCVFNNNIVGGSSNPVDFFVHDTSGGSTTSKKKHEDYLKKYSQVASLGAFSPTIKYNPIVLSEYIQKNFKEDDFIVLKLDIEGSEYEVLQDLIDKNCLSYIDSIFIEWHYENKCDYKNPKGFIEMFNKKCHDLDISIDSSWDALNTKYIKQIRHSMEAKKNKALGSINDSIANGCQVSFDFGERPRKPGSGLSREDKFRPWPEGGISSLCEETDKNE